MTKILKVNEYVNNIIHQKITEMSTINDPKDNNMPFNLYEVSVHSDDHIPAHFHYRNNNGSMNIKISIETLEIIWSAPRKGISKKSLNTWEGLSKERNILKKWLNDKNAAFPFITNFQNILSTWNTYHKYDQVDPSLKNPWL